jgi:hypothetical protein
VGVLGVLGERAPDLDGFDTARQDGDAVPALLPMPDRAITRTTDRVDREPFLGCLELLKTGDIGSGFSKPVEEHTEPRVDPVHIVGRDPYHCRAQRLRSPL